MASSHLPNAAISGGIFAGLGKTTGDAARQAPVDPGTIRLAADDDPPMQLAHHRLIDRGRLGRQHARPGVVFSMGGEESARILAVRNWRALVQYPGGESDQIMPEALTRPLGRRRGLGIDARHHDFRHRCR